MKNKKVMKDISPAEAEKLDNKANKSKKALFDKLLDPELFKEDKEKSKKNRSFKKLLG